MSESPRDITRRFLNAFTTLEAVLRERTKAPGDDHLSFNSMLHRFKKELRPQQYQRFEELSRLRNVIVHNPYEDNIPIATPRTSTVEWLEKQVSVIESPPRVLEALKLTPPQVLNHDDDLSAFLAVTVEPLNFSQAPVRMSDNSLKLITTNAVTRWLGHTYRDGDGAVLEESNIGPIVEKYAEHGDELALHSRDLLVVQALQLFNAEDSRRPTAIVITEHAKANQKPLGILTSDDIVELNQALGLLD